MVKINEIGSDIKNSIMCSSYWVFYNNEYCIGSSYGRYIGWTDICYIYCRIGDSINNIRVPHSSYELWDNIVGLSLYRREYSDNRSLRRNNYETTPHVSITVNGRLQKRIQTALLIC